MANFPLASRTEAFLRCLWSSTQRDVVIFESRLELARLLFADFEPSVVGIVAQPFLLQTEVKAKQRRHIPDYLFVTHQGPVVVEVKPQRRLADPTTVSTFEWTRAAVQPVTAIPHPRPRLAPPCSPNSAPPRSRRSIGTLVSWSASPNDRRPHSPSCKPNWSAPANADTPPMKAKYTHRVRTRSPGPWTRFR